MKQNGWLPGRSPCRAHLAVGEEHGEVAGQKSRPVLRDKKTRYSKILIPGFNASDAFGIKL
jgi:hypothetical protein